MGWEDIALGIASGIAGGTWKGYQYANEQALKEREARRADDLFDIQKEKADREAQVHDYLVKEKQYQQNYRDELTNANKGFDSELKKIGDEYNVLNQFKPTNDTERMETQKQRDTLNQRSQDINANMFKNTLGVHMKYDTAAALKMQNDMLNSIYALSDRDPKAAVSQYNSMFGDRFGKVERLDPKAKTFAEAMINADASGDVNRFNKWKQVAEDTTNAKSYEYLAANALKKYQETGTKADYDNWVSADKAARGYAEAKSTRYHLGGGGGGAIGSWSQYEHPVERFDELTNTTTTKKVPIAGLFKNAKNGTFRDQNGNIYSTLGEALNAVGYGGAVQQSPLKQGAAPQAKPMTEAEQIADAKKKIDSAMDPKDIEKIIAHPKAPKELKEYGTKKKRALEEDKILRKAESEKTKVAGEGMFGGDRPQMEPIFRFRGGQQITTVGDLLDQMKEAERQQLLQQRQ